MPNCYTLRRIAFLLRIIAHIALVIASELALMLMLLL